MEGDKYEKSKYSHHNEYSKNNKYENNRDNRNKFDKHNKYDKHEKNPNNEGYVHHSKYDNKYSQSKFQKENEENIDKIYKSNFENNIKNESNVIQENSINDKYNRGNKDNDKYNRYKEDRKGKHYKNNDGKDKRFECFNSNDDNENTSGLNVFDINLNFYNLKNCNSKISCHARPSKENIIDMKKKFNLNYLITIHSDRENPNEIGDVCKELNIKWKHINLYGANMRLFSKLSTKLLLIQEINDIYEDLLTNDYIAFVHCAYGLHRTGTLVYSIIRMFGDSPEASYDALKIIREATWKNVGSKRLIYVEEEIIPFAFEVKKEKDKRLLLSNNIKSNQNNEFIDINAIESYSSGKLIFI